MIACLGAVAMAAALPKTNVIIGTPVGVAMCLWAWYGESPRRAFWSGWLAGIVYFSLAFSWFGETAGAFIAPFGAILTLGPAIGDGFFGFALAAAAIAWLARRRGLSLALPFGAAAALTLGEWLRSAGIGPLDVPFAQLSLPLVDGPLAPIAAVVGCFGLTFVIALVGAQLALVVRTPRAPANVRAAALTALAIGVATGFAWTTWPARDAPLPTLRVAAIQGGIAQSVKHRPDAILTAMTRYRTMTDAVVPVRPALVLWPETVIPVDLASSDALRASYRDLARRLGGELAVGSLELHGGTEFNSLYFFGSRGTEDGVYRKRELVPFAEALPAPWLAGLPFTDLIGRFGRGTTLGVTRIGTAGATLRVAPLICWESAFTDHAVADARAGADVLLIATDDAWFGTTAGPYQHAQIAQMRAIETGRWVLRAAATGISGIIAPDGRWATPPIGLQTSGTVIGVVGPGVTTVYDRLGSAPVVIALAVLVVLVGLRRRIRPA